MRNLNFLIKPASSLCNLRCRYCFYENESANRKVASLGIMQPETVQTLLDEAFSAISPGGHISFAFQGGEPTVAGLAFFQHFAALAKEKKPPYVSISFAIQTNAVLLDEQWAEFFHDERFLVGVSLDGVSDLHNIWRVDAAGKDTWNKAVRSVAMLQKKQVELNALCVVTGQLARSPQKVYQSLKKLGFTYHQYIACLDPIGVPRGSMPWSLSPEAYGDFLCELFDLWYRDWETGQYRSIRLFDDYVHLLLGDSGSTCATCGTCGAYLVVEADGSVYPCDFYVLDEWNAGKLGEKSLREIAEGDVFRRFLACGKEKPEPCRTCRWRALCNGGCKNDWIYLPEDLSGTGNPRNYYCSSFRQFFAYAEKRLLFIARSEQQARQLRQRPRP